MDIPVPFNLVVKAADWIWQRVTKALLYKTYAASHEKWATRVSRLHALRLLKTEIQRPPGIAGAGSVNGAATPCKGSILASHLVWSVGDGR